MQIHRISGCTNTRNVSPCFRHWHPLSGSSISFRSMQGWKSPNSRDLRECQAEKANDGDVVTFDIAAAAAAASNPCVHFWPRPPAAISGCFYRKLFHLCPKDWQLNILITGPGLRYVGRREEESSNIKLPSSSSIGRTKCMDQEIQMLFMVLQIEKINLKWDPEMGVGCMSLFTFPSLLTSHVCVCAYVFPVSLWHYCMQQKFSLLSPCVISVVITTTTTPPKTPPHTHITHQPRAGNNNQLRASSRNSWLQSSYWRSA